MRTVAISLLLLHSLFTPLRAEIVDRMAAVVDSHAIPWSTALDEANYQAFRNGQEPLQTLDGEALRKITSQMIDQELLEKEMSAGLFTAPNNDENEKTLEAIRKRFPDQQSYEKALVRYKLSDAALVQRLKRETGILAFVDFRLRPQVRLAPEMAGAYYRDTLLPELRQREQSVAPSLEEVRGQIEQILVQQEISRLLETWLQELRRRAKIRILL